MGCGFAVCIVLGMIGAALLFLAEARWRAGRSKDAWIIGAVGGGFCLAAAGLVGPMRRDVARAHERRRLEDTRPNEPWAWNTAWTGRTGIVQSGRRHGRTLIFFGVAALVVSSPVWFVLPGEIKRGNHAAWIALVFPVVGIGILAAAGHDLWRRRKYGLARFVAASVPVPFGTEVAGMVIVDRPVIPIGHGRASLDCWCTSLNRRGGKREQRDDVVAHTEREMGSSDWKTSVSESQLFVQMPLRGGAPTTMTALDAENPVYEWRLRIEAPTAGADFVAEFVLPVFEIAGLSGTGSQPVEFGVPATGGRAHSNRVEIWRAAGISEEPQAGATGAQALVFPSGQGRKLLAAPMTIFVIFAVLASVLWWSPAPGFLAVFFGLFALLPALILKSLWSGGGERVWLESEDICIQTGVRPVRRIPLSDIQTIESNKNVGVGTQQFYRVVARCRPRRSGRFPSRVEIASMVRGDEASGEVIAWLQERIAKSDP